MPLSRGVRGLIRMWPMPLSSRCQWNADPNSWPFGLDLVDGEGQLGHDLVHELDRGLLVAAGVGAQDPEPGAVVDGR